jgi:methionyl aminopeptidase
VVSADGSPAAHYEHTVAITPDGPWILTAEDGGQAGFAAIGARSFAGSGAEGALSEERLRH